MTRVASPSSSGTFSDAPRATRHVSRIEEGTRNDGRTNVETPDAPVVPASLGAARHSRRRRRSGDAPQSRATRSRTPGTRSPRPATARRRSPSSPSASSTWPSSTCGFPKVDGLTIFRRLRQRSPSTSVILMTAFATVPDAVASLRDGAYDYVTKPFDPEEFSLRVIGHIAEHRALRQELEEARKMVASRDAGAPIIGHTPGMRQLIERINTVAQSDAPVLIRGESGTGKELVARTLHARSPRKNAPFVAVNCAAFPETLIEAELFGHERGAFTGAVRKREGRFKAADGGTLLLDEVAEIPLPVQAKLLRVLQEGVIEPLGTNTLGARERAHRLGDAPRSQGAHRAGEVPRGPLLPPQRARPRTSRRCASAARTCRCSWRTFSGASIRGACRRASRRARGRRSWSTRSPATCASSRTRSSAPSCSRTAARSISSTSRRTSRARPRRPSRATRACGRSASR